MIAISGQEISKTYGYYQVLREVNLEVGCGECYALFGPNGAGKTTLLRILATLQRPTTGRFEILGRDGLKERDTVRATLLLLAHGCHLYEDLNAWENVQFALALRGLSLAQRQVKAVLDRVAIGAFADMKVRFFSAGMKKRLALAKAMLAQPKVLLLDEPFSTLDKAGIEILKQFILETLARGGGVLMATHNQEKAAEVAKRAGVLSHGADVGGRQEVALAHPYEDVGVLQRIVHRAFEVVRVGIAQERPFDGAEVCAIHVDDASAVGHNHFTDGDAHVGVAVDATQHAGDGDPCRAGAVDDHFDLGQVLAQEARGIDQRRQHDDGRAVLVVVEDRDAQVLQPFLDLEATRS